MARVWYNADKTDTVYKEMSVMFCPMCGNDVQQEAAFCDKCGYRLAQSEPSAVRTGEKYGAKHIKAALLCTLGAAALFVLVNVILALGGKELPYFTIYGLCSAACGLSLCLAMYHEEGKSFRALPPLAAGACALMLVVNRYALYQDIQAMLPTIISLLAVPVGMYAGLALCRVNAGQNGVVQLAAFAGAGLLLALLGCLLAPGGMEAADVLEGLMWALSDILAVCVAFCAARQG